MAARELIHYLEAVDDPRPLSREERRELLRKPRRLEELEKEN